MEWTLAELALLFFVVPLVVLLLVSIWAAYSDVRDDDYLGLP